MQAGCIAKEAGPRGQALEAGGTKKEAGPLGRILTSPRISAALLEFSPGKQEGRLLAPMGKDGVRI